MVTEEEKAEFDKDCTIDPSQLDVEAVRQAETFFRWAEKLVTVRSQAEQLKAEIGNVKSSLSLQIRAKPEKYGLAAKTEAAIEAAILSHRSYREAEEAWYKARERQAWLEQVVTAMEQKKRMIEVLVTLHGQEYFAGPSTPRSLVDAWKEYREGNSAKVHTRQIATARRRVRPGD